MIGYHRPSPRSFSAQRLKTEAQHKPRCRDAQSAAAEKGRQVMARRKQQPPPRPIWRHKIAQSKRVRRITGLPERWPPEPWPDARKLPPSRPPVEPHAEARRFLWLAETGPKREHRTPVRGGL
jgi:hypothetical protein